MKAPSRQPASTRGRMPPNNARSWVRISRTPSMPSRRQTSVALTATSAAITIIDQPIGLRDAARPPRRRRPAPGLLTGVLTRQWGLAGHGGLDLLRLAGTAKQTEERPYPMRESWMPMRDYGSRQTPPIPARKTKGRQPDATAPKSQFEKPSVIPGRCQRVRPPAGPMTSSASNPESRDSGSDPSDHPGMTELTSGFREQLVDILPVHQMIDKRLQIIRTAIAIIDVVGVLPDIDAEDRRGAVHQRILAVRRLGDFELAVLHRQPGPARTELANAGGGEIGLEFLQPAEVLGDFLFQAAGQFVAAAIRLHPVPEMQMVVMLAGVVEQRRILAERALDDLLKRLALEFGAFQQIVAVGHIGLVMLVVVEFQGFLGHMGRKRVIGVRKGGEREGHGMMSALVGDGV